MPYPNSDPLWGREAEPWGGAVSRVEFPGRNPEGRLSGDSLVWLKLIYPKFTQINEALNIVSSFLL